MAETTRLVHATAVTPRPVFSEGYKRVVLITLTLVYTLNFLDRSVVNIIGQPMKVSLGITDGQLGLLNGLAFAVLYTLLGVPIARLAERWSRVNIVAVCIVLWSGFTALCGLAPNFAAMLAFRAGVGVGEAGCSPPSHSLISDYYAPKRRASALAVFAFGSPLGGMLGAILGGLIAEFFGWRAAFFIVGIPGVLVALMLKLLIKEPPRGYSEVPVHRALLDAMPNQAPPAPVRSFSEEIVHEARELGAVGRRIFGTWSFLNMTLGLTLALFAGNAAIAFSSPYFIRTFGLGLALVGGVTGIVSGATGLSTLLGGFTADWLRQRSTVWYALISGFGLLITMPLHFLAFTRSDWRVAAWVLILSGLFQALNLAPTFGAIQNAVATNRRATATALMFVCLTLIGASGPPFTGWLIDQFGQFNFTHPGVHTILGSLGRIFLHGEAAGVQFRDLCPGGVPRKGVAAALTAACRPALARATQEGALVTFFFFGWAALHYFLAALTLPKDLRMAAAERGELA